MFKSHIVRKLFKNTELKGSYTLEAAFLLPVFFICIAFGMRMSVDLYNEVKEAAIVSEDILELSPVKIIYGKRALEKGVETINGNTVSKGNESKSDGD